MSQEENYVDIGNEGEFLDNIKLHYCPKCQDEKLFVYREPVFFNEDHIYDDYACETCDTSVPLNKTAKYYELMGENPNPNETQYGTDITNIISED